MKKIGLFEHSSRLLCSAVLSLSISLLAGCASNRSKTIGLALAGGAVGAIYGNSQPDYKTENATMYGAAAAVTLGALGLFLFDSEHKISDLERANEELNRKLAVAREKDRPSLISEGDSLMAAPLPKDLSGLVQLGRWKRYSLDQWVQDENNPNIWYRQKEMFEVVPPQIRNE